MENVVFAFVVMAISAFVALYAGQRAGKSKTYVYALGLAVMLVQIAVLFAARDWTGDHGFVAAVPQPMAGTSRTL